MKDLEDYCNGDDYYFEIAFVWFGFVGLDSEIQWLVVPYLGLSLCPNGGWIPSTKQLELQTAWDKGGILRPVQEEDLFS